MELIDAHAETGGPESRLKRHLHRPAFCQCMKDAFCIRKVLELDRHGKPFWLVIVPGRCVRSHQHCIAYSHPCVKNLIAPFSRHLYFRRRACMGKHPFDLATENLLIELESRLAISVE